MSFLLKLVLDKLNNLSDKEAAEFFETSALKIKKWRSGASAIPISALEKVFDPTDPAGIKSEGALWEGKKLALLLPWYKTTNPVTSFSILTMLDRQKMAVMLNFGDAFIAHTRNTLSEHFLRSNLEWALTIDDDMVLPCGNAKWFNDMTGFALPEKFAGMHSANRLLSHGKTLVGGLYFGRWRHGKPVFAEGGEPMTEEHCRRGPHDECRPTKWVGTGCMLIHRSVFLDIEKNFPHLSRDKDGNHGHWFTSSEHDLRQASRDALAVLQDEKVSTDARVAQAQKLIADAQHRSRYHSSLGMGEDVAFCVRATQSGHQPHVDLGLLCGHMGNLIFGKRKILV